MVNANMIQVNNSEKITTIPSTHLSYKERKILNPLFRIGRIYSLCPPDFSKQRSIICSWYNLYSVLVLTSLCLLCTWALINKWHVSDQYSSYTVLLFDILTVILLTLFNISSIINAVFLKKDSIKKLLTDLKELDYLMRQNQELLPKRQKLITVELTILHIFLLVSYCYDIYSNAISFEPQFYLTKISDYINEYLMALQVLLFRNYILSIKYKLESLNQSLMDFGKSTPQSFPKEYKLFGGPPKHSTFLTNHIDVHNKLCNIIDLFNNCFGLQIVGILFIGVIYNTHVLFLLLMYGSGKATPNSDVSVVYVLLACIYIALIYMVTIPKKEKLCTNWMLQVFGMIITISCTGAIRAARRTSAICFKLLLNMSLCPKALHERVLRKELLLFAEQVSQRQINFTGGGFLTIDYNTLYTLFGSTAMNVIILLQFQTQ
jgi:hypothetical protein